VDSVLARTWAEQRSGADRANGGLVACGCHPGRGGSPPALERHSSSGRIIMGVK